MTGNVRNARPSCDIGLVLAHHSIKILDGGLVRSSHPIAHGRRSRFAAIGLLDTSCRRRILEDVIGEATDALAPISRGDGRCAVTALFETHVAVCRVVVARADLKFNPGGGDRCPSLNAALEGLLKSDEGSRTWTELDGFVGVGEIWHRCAIAIGQIVEEAVGLLLMRFICQDNAGP